MGGQKEHGDAEPGARQCRPQIRDIHMAKEKQPSTSAVQQGEEPKGEPDVGCSSPLTL